MAKRKNKTKALWEKTSSNTSNTNDTKYLDTLEKSRKKALKQTEYDAKWGWLEDTLLFGLLITMISYVVWEVI